MAKQYDLSVFLGKLSLFTLKQFCDWVNLEFEYIETNDKNDAFGQAITFFESLSTEDAKTVEAHFKAINDLTPEAGIEMLIEKACDQGLELPDNREEYSTYDLSTWFYLNHPELFQDTLTKYDLWDTSGWLDVYIQNSNQNNIRQKNNELQEAIQEYIFEKRSVRKHCVVKLHERDDGKITYVAFPQGFAKLEIGYGNSGQLDSQQVTQPVEHVYFTYDEATSMLSVKAKGGKPVKQKYAQLFTVSVLGQKVEFMQNKVFDLNKITDPDFEMPTEADVERVLVKSIALLRMDGTARYTLDVFDDGSATGLEGVRKHLQTLNHPERGCYVAQARIYAKFRNPPKGTRGTVTVQLGWPNSHNFADKQLHNRLREYLEQWGLIQFYSHELASGYGE